MKKALAAVLALLLALAGATAAAEIQIPDGLMPELPNVVPAESAEVFLGAWEMCGYTDPRVTVLDKASPLVALLQLSLDITEQEITMHLRGEDETYEYEFLAEDGTLLMKSSFGKTYTVCLYKTA